MHEPTPRRPRPAWGALYAAVVILLGVLAIVEVRIADGGARRAVEFLVTLGVFLVAAGWVKLNCIAIELEGQRARPLRRVVPAEEARLDGIASGDGAFGDVPARVRGARLVVVGRAAPSTRQG
jgi:hypothetical protein